MSYSKSLGLSPDTLLGIHLAAEMTRHKFTHDPEPVIEELRAIAAGRDDILAQQAGIWAGFHDDEHTHALAAALMQIDGAEEWIELGRRRQGARPFTSEGFQSPRHERTPPR